MKPARKMPRSEESSGGLNVLEAFDETENEQRGRWTERVLLPASTAARNLHQAGIDTEDIQNGGPPVPNIVSDTERAYQALLQTHRDKVQSFMSTVMLESGLTEDEVYCAQPGFLWTTTTAPPAPTPLAIPRSAIQRFNEAIGATTAEARQRVDSWVYVQTFCRPNVAGAVRKAWELMCRWSREKNGDVSYVPPIETLIENEETSPKLATLTAQMLVRASLSNVRGVYTAIAQKTTLAQTLAETLVVQQWVKQRW